MANIQQIGEVFDIGRTTLKALSKFELQLEEAPQCGGDSEIDNGNGSLMRMLPIAYYIYFNTITEDKEIYRIVKEVSSITHKHEISILGCYIYVMFVIEILNGKLKEKAYENIQHLDYSAFCDQTVQKYHRILKQNIIKLKEEEINSSGYIVDTLEAVLWLFMNGKDYHNTILKAVNLGGDTDTIAACTGGLLGIYYGIESIDENWKKSLKKIEEIKKLCHRFYEINTMERVELSLHTKMSKLKGIASFEDYNGYLPKIAITDYESVQAFPKVQEFIKENSWSSDVIYGIEVNYCPYNEIKEDEIFHMTILAKNQTGLKNLYKLVSFSELNSKYEGHPIVLKDMLEQNREGLLIGTSNQYGELYSAILKSKSDEEFKRIAQFYDYLEVQPTRKKEDNEKIVKIGEDLGKIVVATGDVYFERQEEKICQEILNYNFEEKKETENVYFRTTKEMLKCFEYLGKKKAFEIVVKNTNKIANMCEKVIPIPEGKFYPHLPNSKDELLEMTYKKAYSLYGNPLPKKVQARCDQELNSILENDFVSFYSITQKLVEKSNQDGYMVASRGTVGSSFVANMLGITEINPLKPHYRCPKCKYSEFQYYGVKCGFDLPDKKCPKCGNMLEKDGMNIPFESFGGLNGEKEPDIALNFSGEYQERVYQYAGTILGENKTFRAGTVCEICEKNAFEYTKKYCTENNLPLFNKKIPERLVGIKKYTREHPGRMIVVPEEKEIFDFTPIQYSEKDSNVICSHFDYHSLNHKLLKLDLLAHDVPTMIKMLQDFTGILLSEIRLEDKETMSLFYGIEALKIAQEQDYFEVGTVGLPEFGSIFMRRMLLDIKPSSFEELIKLSGFSHGANVWKFNADKLLKENKIKLDEAISCREDIFLYLSSKGLNRKDAFEIMELVKLGKVSKLKNFGGTKAMHDQWENLVKIMKTHNVPNWYINCCEKIEYLFPRAHAVSYVLNSFRIAWFKVHYPLSFYATYFSIHSKEFDYELMARGKEKVKNKMREIEENCEDDYYWRNRLYEYLEVVLEMYERGFDFLTTEKDKPEGKKFTIEKGKIKVE